MYGFHNCRYCDQCDSAIEILLRLKAGADALPASLLFGLAKTRRCRLQHRYGLWHIGESYACHVVREKLVTAGINNEGSILKRNYTCSEMQINQYTPPGN
jgi:hypothetical protein